MNSVSRHSRQGSTELTQVVRTLAAALSKWNARTLLMPSVMRVSTYLKHRERASVLNGSPSLLSSTTERDRLLTDSHFPSLQRDDHFVISDEVGLAAVERDLHFVLHP